MNSEYGQSSFKRKFHRAEETDGGIEADESAAAAHRRLHRHSRSSPL